MPTLQSYVCSRCGLAVETTAFPAVVFIHAAAVGSGDPSGLSAALQRLLERPGYRIELCPTCFDLVVQVAAEVLPEPPAPVLPPTYAEPPQDPILPPEPQEPLPAPADAAELPVAPEAVI
jgi:hypothetical protein